MARGVIGFYFCVEIKIVEVSQFKEEVEVFWRA